MSKSFPIQSGQGNGAFGTSVVARGYLSQLRKRKGLNFNFATSALAANLVSFWNMDEPRGTRKDSHYPRYHLGQVNEVTTGGGFPGGTANPIPRAIFDPATGGYLSRINAIDFQAQNDFTLGVWIYPTDDGTDRTIASKGVEWALRRSTTGVPTFAWLGSGGTGAGTAPSLTWTLVWIRYLIGTNGRSVTTNANGYGSTTTDASFPANFVGDLNIGKAAASSNIWKGLIGPVAYWKRALIDAERTAYYNGGVGVSYPI